MERPPAVGALLNEPAYQALIMTYSHNLVADALRAVIEGEKLSSEPLSASQRLERVASLCKSWSTPSPRTVLNLTGVVLHTNLGRAILAKSAAEAAFRAATSYTDVEIDLLTGKRGARIITLKEQLRLLCKTEAATVVNNNAAAVMLGLAALCKGKQVIVSRGQLVEIGGGFRMPEIMKLAGVKLVEIGTTNKTRLSDYEEAVTEKTAAILFVHQSNFRLIGFQQAPTMVELGNLARSRNLLFLVDLGSGALASEGVFSDEPSIAQAFAAGCDLCFFSGDKLFGGPQAGIIAGKKEPIQKIEKHPLYRAVRIDKIRAAALSATATLYLTGRANEVPTFKMLTEDNEFLRRKAAYLKVRLQELGIKCELTKVESAAGAGSLPEVPIESWAVLILAQGGVKAHQLYQMLLQASMPVIGRTTEKGVLLDVRTLLDGQFELLINSMTEIKSKLG